MTFIASVEPACMLGAAPVFCDIEPDTYNLDPFRWKRISKAFWRRERFAPGQS